MTLGPRQTSQPSGILIRATVWHFGHNRHGSEYTKVADRQRGQTEGEPFDKRSPKSHCESYGNGQILTPSTSWLQTSKRISVKLGIYSFANRYGTATTWVGHSLCKHVICHVLISYIRPFYALFLGSRRSHICRLMFAINRQIHHMTCFRTRRCLFWVAI